MAPWLPAGFDERDGSEFSPTAHPLVLCFQNTIQLTTILRRFLTHSMSIDDSAEGGHIHPAVLNRVNLDLCRWQESLPDILRWNKWEPTTKPLKPVVAALQLVIPMSFLKRNLIEPRWLIKPQHSVLFNSIRIAVNFDIAVLSGASEHITVARHTCEVSAQDIIALVRKYRSQHGLHHAPLIFVYGIVQAARFSSSQRSEIDTKYLLQALDDSSVTWELARQTKLRLFQSKEVLPVVETLSER